MLKLLIGAFMIFNTIALYCCVVVGKRYDEQWEEFRSKEEQERAAISQEKS